MPHDERDENSGKFEPKYQDSEFVEAVANLSDHPTTREVASEVGCDHDTARRRLNRLADEQRVERTMIAATIVWSLVEEEEESEA